MRTAVPPALLGDRWSNDVFLSSSTTPFFPFGEGFTSSLPPPKGLDGRGTEVAEAPFSPKIDPRGPQMLQYGLPHGSR